MMALRYRLALDLGAQSLGWAVLKLNDQDQVSAIVRSGSRIFHDGRNPKDGTSLAVTRRNARAMRRRRDRLLQRKSKFINALVRHGFFPDDLEERKALELLNPYQLRSEGLRRALSPAEFARALFHLNQRRGFQSNRKTDTKDAEDGLMKRAIKALQQELSANAAENTGDAPHTLGDWLWRCQQRGLDVRARSSGQGKQKAFSFYASRAMVQAEFDALWLAQQRLHAGLPDAHMFSQEVRETLYSILFFQRPLKPVQAGRCSLLPDLRRAPLALPSTQRFRIWQEVANLRLLDAQLQALPLSLAQKNTVAQLLESKARISFDAIRKSLRLPSDVRFNLEDDKRKELKGNLSSVALSKPEMFGQAWFSLSADMQERIVQKLLDEDNAQTLIDWLQQACHVDAEQAERIANCSLPQGYGNLSQEAQLRILPQMQQNNLDYSAATEAAGLGSHSALQHGQQTGELFERLPYYGVVLQRHIGFARDNPRNEEERLGKIANPTVHIGLNQVRVVVNELIESYGRPAQVVLEVARELKQSREQKLEIQKQQAARQKRNQILLVEACAILQRQPDHLDGASRRELLHKMQLWQELNPANPLQRCCPYTGELISIQRLLSDEVEIEHILPYSKTLDDSLMNKTVALRRANRIKREMTPYEAFGANSVPGFVYADMVERAKVMPASKRKRFAPDGLQQWLQHEGDDFLARALNDTAYLSRIAREYLCCLYAPSEGQKVWVLPGRMTAMIRGKFGLNELLSGSEEKNRNDHRHHALDAMVIGVIDRSLLNKMAQAHSRAKEKGMQRLLDKLEYPWPTYRDHVERALHAIWVSQRPDHGWQGAMLEDKAWGWDAKGQAHRHDWGLDGSRVKQVANKELIKIYAPNQISRHGIDENGHARPYKGYVGGSNYCIEIWCDERGRWKGDVISTFQVYALMRKEGEVQGQARLRDPNMTLSGKPLVMRLTKKDYLRLQIDGVTKTMLIASVRGNGQIYMAPHQEANVDARDADKSDPFSYVSKMPGSLQKAQARRCTISPAGRLHDPGWRA
ncbi:type II CRISPR RNA-guided endonuclease Cas9 [Massilia sp. W12]|uniref:type II CRISPR RNA-guided endonuclease Cas9 n=1 Tax=Massilia sp. W12 TaxID=3126507 RepID=UPI0030D19393